MDDIQIAIKNFERAREIYLQEFGINTEVLKLYDTAISAMEELNQYRELYKPEEIEHFKTLARIIRRHGTIGKALDTCAEYEAIGTLEECREARERQQEKE